jgi:hypothetical protein
LLSIITHPLQDPEVSSFHAGPFSSPSTTIVPHPQVESLHHPLGCAPRVLAAAPLEHVLSILAFQTRFLVVVMNATRVIGYDLRAALGLGVAF